MSPLVALLALACASPLLAARIKRDTVSECATKMEGHATGHPIQLPTVPIKPRVADGTLDVTDNCALVNLVLVGENVVACDCQKPPNVVVPSERPFAPVLVHRNSDLTCEVKVDITQYCQ